MTYTEFEALRVTNPNLIVTCPETQDAALALARGCYQADLLTGRETLSGAGLKGKASSYAGQYARSRASLLRRMVQADIEFTEVRGVRGKRILVLGPVPTAGEAVQAA